MTRWAVVGVESSVPWPTAETEVRFRGHVLLLRPGTDRDLPSVAFRHPATMRFEEALLVIRHFLSSLAWVERRGIREVAAGGGSRPVLLGRGQRGMVITERFRQDYLPDPAEPRTRLALAFYREAMASEPIAYRFLNLFKIVNILYARGQDQIAWINATLPSIHDFSVASRLSALGSEVPDVGAYLYESGRCAVAHAFNQPLVDPENLADNRRLSEDLPVLQALAEYLIEHELGVKSRATIWKEHLYELEGFRQILGEALVRRLKAREPIDPSDIPAFPLISIRVRDKATGDSLSSLQPVVIAVDNGTIWLRCDSTGRVAQFLIGLAVADEALLFDPQEHMAVSPDNSLSALRARHDQGTLLRDLLCNGQLEIIDATNQNRLGRTDAYVGENINLTATLRHLDGILASLNEAIQQAVRSSDA
jgi:hypothetical protein